MVAGVRTKTMSQTIAIIGAGMAGLAAARRLHELRPDLTITVYEKSHALGGRAASRRRGMFLFDHGAQYLKASTPELERLIHTELPGDELLDIARPVWTFDGAGTIAEGDPAQNADPKWSYTTGLATLGELLGEDLDVRREVRVASLRRPKTQDPGAQNQESGTKNQELPAFDDTRRSDHQPPATSNGPSSSVHRPRWVLADTQGQPIGEADVVLLTPPGPQTAEIIGASELPNDQRASIVAELGRVVYRRCLSFALAYPRLIARPFYALVNIDRSHPISWLALEHDKGAQRCPPGHSLLIAQMAPQWSVDHWDILDEQIGPVVAGLIGDLLSEDLDEPLWCDRHGWRYALPDGAASIQALDAPELGLFFAGDYTAGQGRVHIAIEQGWSAAERILAS
jgi:renalase